VNDNDLADFFTALYGDTAGNMHIAVGDEPHWVDDNYTHKHWTQSHFAYPAEADRAAREIAQAALTSDVYVCVSLMHADKRAQGAAVARMNVHADVDNGRYDPEKVTAVGGFAVASGSTGNAHVYVPLTESVPANVHRELCRGLSRYLGAVDPKITDNDLLRPPGTFNHKLAARGGEPSPVRLLSAPNGRVAPTVLAALVGVELTATPTGTSRPAGHGSAPVNLDRYPSVRRALDHRTKDRSADTYRVTAVCHQVGLTLAETTWAVRTREDLAQRLDGRGDDDLLTIWLKLDDETRTGHRADPPSAPTADGGQLLDAVHEALTRYVVFPAEATAVAVTLWVAATHALPGAERFRVADRLVVTAVNVEQLWMASAGRAGQVRDAVGELVEQLGDHVDHRRTRVVRMYQASGLPSAGRPQQNF
jgi:hypothetical protein